MTQTAAPADFATIVRTWTNEMISNSRNATAVRDSGGNLRELTATEAAFSQAINAEWRRRFNRP